MLKTWVVLARVKYFLGDFMEVKDVKKFENVFQANRDQVFKIGVVVLFVIVIIVLTAMQSGGISNIMLLCFAAVMGGYMALNIGANDVANNVGPAVGSKALTMGGAILIAAICEMAGAIIAGGEVVETVKGGIVSLESIGNQHDFIMLMLAALISSALWLHFATAIGAPVSTTHAIVGGILGSGIAAGGFGVANWGEMARIASSWVISPILGGLVAALFLYFIKCAITYKEDKKLAAQRVVPILVALMTWAFSLYLISKGLKKIISLSPFVSFSLSVVLAIVIFIVVRPLIAKSLEKMSNKKEEINKLFTIPLIFAAALLSFAHGANDVANAIGPLAAINEALKESLHLADSSSSVPFWIMFLGGAGISLGLALYGPKLIRTVGSEITELDQIRAFCIAMSAALTVLIASELGLPVSSTHIAVGAVFGVGFLREYLKKRYKEIELKIVHSHHDESAQKLQEFLEQFRKASVKQKGLMLKNLELQRKRKDENMLPLKKKEQKQLQKVYQEDLVKRSAINKIVAAWLITVPVSAVLSAICYFLISQFGLEI